MMESGKDNSNELIKVSDTISDLVTGIPAPIRKNAVKAFSRLCTAAIEYTVARIECAAEERRAESRARIKLIDTSSRQIAEKMQVDPEYARVAAEQSFLRIIRKQANIDRISEIAATELKTEQSSIGIDEESEATSISEDWLNVFESEAVQMSSEQMRSIFGKILAGEIRRPNSYSIKTIKLMTQLDNRAAALFSLLCSLSISFRLPGSNFIHDARVVSMGNASMNSLHPYGLGFNELNILQEYGLIVSDYNSYMNYCSALAISNENRSIISPVPLVYQNDYWVLVSRDPYERPIELGIAGVAFTQSGKELLSIIDIKPNDQYTAALKDYFNQQGVKMAKLKGD